MSSRKRHKKKEKNLEHTTIDEHYRRGKTLIPPFKNISDMTPMSWRDDRLPEMLWTALLVSLFRRKKAISKIREIADYLSNFRDAENPPYDISFSGISKFNPDILSGFLERLVDSDEMQEVFRPLLLLEGFPGQDEWQRVINVSPKDEDWRSLMIAVAKTLEHQSQEATDCRWARVICTLAAGKLSLPHEEMAKEYIYYPDFGEMRKVRPMIRATEGALTAALNSDSEWPNMFWEQCLRKTNCFPLPGIDKGDLKTGTTVDRISKVYQSLLEHCNRTRTTSATDPKHDTVFGLAFYCLSLIRELLHIGVSHSISGRIMLRSISESFITVSYLARKDDIDLWRSYRVFGAGQAKLAYLKLEELGEDQSYVNIDTLKDLANEDMWEEFLPIELGHWEKMNLRQMSEEAGLKKIYDKYYSWTSTYAHGHWGAVRDSVYDTCGNPLHRLHRIPREYARSLPDVLPDACEIVDRILDVVSDCYPKFTLKISQK